MSRRTHGNLILLMLAAAVVAGLVEYCTTWTREQQERNPVGYLGWLIRDLESLRTVRGRIQRELQRVCEEQQRIEQRCRVAASAALDFVSSIREVRIGCWRWGRCGRGTSLRVR